PAQSPPSSSSGSASGVAAPAVDKGAAPARSASAAQVSSGSTPAAVDAAAADKSVSNRKASATEPATFHEVTIPGGTKLTAKLSTAVASDTSKIEDVVRGTLTTPLAVSGTTVVPTGAEIVGSVLEAKGSGRVKGRAVIAFRFSRLIVGTETHQI